MNRLVLPYLCVCIAVPSMASDFGTTGLIDIPTARMSLDGTLTTTAAIQSRTKVPMRLPTKQRHGLRELSRYTGYNRAIYSYDRNYEAKIRLWAEQTYLPQVAIGIRDLVGTGVWGSEYVVASKESGKF